MKPTGAHCDDEGACEYASSLDDAFSFVDVLDFQSGASLAAQDRTQRQQQQGPDSSRCAHRISASAAKSLPRVSTHCVKSGARSSTEMRCQQQKRPQREPDTDEISRLREQVRQVEEAQHTQDQQQQQSFTTTHTDAAKWLLQAALQYQELQQRTQPRCERAAENSSLRTTLTSQLELQHCLQTQLQELSTLELACQSQAERRSQSSRIRLEPRVTCGSPWIRTEQLHKTMAALYKDTDAAVRQVLNAATDMASIFSSSQSRRDPVRGPLFELKTSASVPASSHVLGDVLWQLLADCESKCENIEDDPAACLGSGHEQDSHEKWYSLDLHTQFGDVQVHGASVLRRFKDQAQDLDSEPQQQQRLVVTYASSIAASESSELVFRESGWFILTQCEPATSLFQTFYRLQLLNHPVSDNSKSSSGAMPIDSDAAYLQEFVMNALSNRTRAHHQQLQNALLAHSRSHHVTKATAPSGLLALIA